MKVEQWTRFFLHEAVKGKHSGRFLSQKVFLRFFIVAAAAARKKVEKQLCTQLIPISTVASASILTKKK